MTYSMYCLVIFVGRNLCCVQDFQEGDWPCVQIDPEDSGDQRRSHHNRRFHGWLGLDCLLNPFIPTVPYSGHITGFVSLF